MARDEGIGEATFNKVKRELGIVSEKIGAEWCWRFPTPEEQAEIPF